MPFFTTTKRAPRTAGVPPRSTTKRSRGFGIRLPFHRTNRNRVAGGYEAALSNPNTTRSGRKQAKRQLRSMGQAKRTHVPIMTKIKRALGIRSTPRRTHGTSRRAGRTLVV